MPEARPEIRDVLWDNEGMSSEHILTPDLARAARALTQVSAKYVGLRADLTREQIRGYERFRSPLSDAQQVRLRRALEEFGATFIEQDDEGGYGVRQKYNSKKVEQLENWEDEGGPVGEDDV